MRKIKTAAKIDKKYFNYERTGRDMWKSLAIKAQDTYNIYWDFENDEAIRQKDITIETPEDAWESKGTPGKMIDDKASFRCELRFAGGDWEQGVFYFCCQSIKGKTFHTDECFVLIPTKEQGNLGLIKNDKGKWYSSQGDEKDVEYSHEKAEKQCWESLPEMLHKAKEAKIEEHKKMSMCLPKEVVAFDNTSEAIQHLADITGVKVVIAGVADQLLKKHQKSNSLDIKDVKSLIELAKKEISKGIEYNNSKVDIHKKQADQIAKLSVDLSLSDSKNISNEDIKENSSFLKHVKKTIDMISVLLYLRKRYPKYNDEEMKKWYNKDINTFKDATDLNRHFDIHKDLLTKDNNDFVSLRPIKKSDGKASKKIADLPTEEVIAGYVIKRLDNENQIPTQEWTDLECGGEKYCITTKNYFGEYSGPPYFWVLKQKGNKFIQKGMIIPRYFYHDLHQALRNDKNDGIMEDSLVKQLMPFLEKHKILEESPIAIRYIDNPSEEMQLEAVKKDGNAIKGIKKPSEKVQLEAVKEDWGTIEYIKNPSEAVQLEAAKRNGSILMYLKNPSEAVKIEAVKNYGYAITYIDNPTEEMKIEAVKNNGIVIMNIDNPSEAIQLEAVKNRKEALTYIENPSKAAIEMASRKEASIKFASINEAIQYLADYTDNRIIIAEDPIPTHLYHATYKPLLPSIKRKGLIKNYQNKNWEDSKDFIYLATSKDIAKSYAETSDIVPEEWIDQIVVFKVDTDKLDLNQLSTDENVQHKKEVSTYQYNKNIPFSNLKIEE